MGVQRGLGWWMVLGLAWGCGEGGPDALGFDDAALDGGHADGAPTEVMNDAQPYDEPPAAEDDPADQPAAPVPDGTLVPVELTGQVLFAPGYPAQIHDALRPHLGEALQQIRLYARFCADPECAEVLAVVEAPLEAAETSDYQILASASPDGTGAAHPFSVNVAPAGRSYFQLIGDTALGAATGQSACRGGPCPGDGDVLQIALTAIQAGPIRAGDSDGPTNPPAATVEVAIAPGAQVTLPGTQYLGHLHFDETPLRQPMPESRRDRFLVAVEDPETGFVQRLVQMAINADGWPEEASDPVILRVPGLATPGDICGLLRGDEGLFAVVRGPIGIWILGLDFEGRPMGPPVAFLPNPAPEAVPPAPCRGAFARIEGRPFLYLHEYAGTGSRPGSGPYPLVVVDVEARTVSTPYQARFEASALRGLVVDAAGRRLIVSEMSWAAQPNNIGTMVTAIDIEADGQLGRLESVIHMGRPVDETCGANHHWPGALTRLTVGGIERLAMGHDVGVTIFALDTLQPITDLDLRAYGRLYRQIAVSPDGGRAYAVPQCMARPEDGWLMLPAAGDSVPTDRHLAVELDLTGDEVRVADRTLDVDEDGEPDPGLDLTYHFLKQYLRQYDPTMPLPLPVLNAPEVAVGKRAVILRGYGVDSAGLGQAGDVAFFNRRTGRGLLLNGYLPWWDGVTGAWGHAFEPGRSSRIGWVEYLPSR